MNFVLLCIHVGKCLDDWGGGGIQFDKDGSDTSMKDVENKCAYFFFL